MKYPDYHSNSASSKSVGEGITVHDVLPLPRRSDFFSSDADVRTRLAAAVEFNIPPLSAFMDTVMEAALAIALVQEGEAGLHP